MTKKLRILHAPTNTGNNPWTLSRAERKLGLQSDLWIFESHKFYQNYNRNFNLSNLTLPGEISKIKAFKAALKNYDIFHFNFGFSWLDYPYIGLDYFDLNILKKAGKIIIMTFQGDDAYQKAYFTQKFSSGPDKNHQLTLIDRLANWRKRSRIEKITRLADKIYTLSPDLLHVLPPETEFLPYAVELPLASKKPLGRSKIRLADKAIRIIHMPSQRFTKDTEAIFPVIAALKEKYRIDFRLIENQDYQTVQKIYNTADIAIDQLAIGWYGAFAVEMMARGVPTIAYLCVQDMEKYVPFHQEIPIINADQHNLYEALEVLIQNPQLRQKLGRKSQNFVQRYHSPIRLAKRLKKEYNTLVKTRR